jgi:hypothetical protein
MALCQAYTTAFCTTVEPNPYIDPWIATPLSARWQRVAIQHAVGIARSWRSNHDRAYREHLEDCAHYAQLQNPRHPAPTWKERMNAYLYASNLGHIPRQLAWKARKNGQTARAVWAAYSSQCCSQCAHTSRDNRPVQQTFCCEACGFTSHADENAAVNIQARFHDEAIQRCRSKEAVKALLEQRHRASLNGCP